MSQTTEVKDTAATANSTMTRDASADSALRRINLSSNGGGLANSGFEQGGVLSTSATTTLDPTGSVNGVLVTVDASGAAKTINLPAAATWAGLVYEVEKIRQQRQRGHG